MAMTPLAFRHYLGIHYAGAETPDSGLKTLRVYSATPDPAAGGPASAGAAQVLVPPGAGPLADRCAAHLSGFHPQRGQRPRRRAHGQPALDAADG